LTESAASLNANVAEARMVGEERKWRLKLDEIQEGLAKQLQRIDVLDAQTVSIAKTITSYDTSLDKNASSVRELEARLFKTETDLAEARESFDRRCRRTESHANSMGDVVEKVAALAATTKDTASKACSMEERLAASERRRQEELKEIRQKFGKHHSRIDTLDEPCTKLVERVATHDTAIATKTSAVQSLEPRHSAAIEGFDRRVDMLARDTEDMVSRIVAIDARIQQNNGQLDDVEAQLSNASKEQHDELQVVCKRLDQHETALGCLPQADEFKAQLRIAEEGLFKAVAELSSDCRRERAELSKSLNGMALASDLKETRESVQAWVDKACRAHQINIQGLESSLKQVAARALEQGTELRQHQDYMKELSAWLNHGMQRDEAITEILLHIVEEDYPDLLPAIEKRLQSTSRSSR